MQNLIGPKPLSIKFDKIDVFIRAYTGSIYIYYIFGIKDYYAIYITIRYPISLKSSITYVVFFYYYAKIKVDFYGSLLLKTYNVILLYNIKLMLYNKHKVSS